MMITQALHRNVQHVPDAPATICGDRVRSWAESAERVARLAGVLGDLGVEADDRVAILALNSDRYHEYLLGVPWADAVINPVNVRWSPAEIAYSLEESDSKVLMVDDKFAPMLPALHDRWSRLTTVIYCGDGDAPDGTMSYEDLVAAHQPVPDAGRGGDSLAGVFYTGGTTGTPKGVMLSHANLLWSATGSLASGMFVAPGGRLLHAAPMFHLAGWRPGWPATSLVAPTSSCRLSSPRW